MDSRADRLALALRRDEGRCVWCRRELGAGEASLEHVVPRLKGGPAWPENEVAACRPCNRRRGHVSPLEWLDRCEREGGAPNRRAIEHSLHALRDAIDRLGGQRRARPYLDGQLRRLAKRR